MLVFSHHRRLHHHHHPLTSIFLPVVLPFPIPPTHTLPNGRLFPLFKDLDQLLATL